MRREATASRFHFARLTERTASVRPAARGGTSEVTPKSNRNAPSRKVFCFRSTKKRAPWDTLRKEGAPIIYFFLLFGLWCHNPMLAIPMDLIFQIFPIT